MATYIITDSLEVNSSDGSWGIDKFKNRFKSTKGESTAQEEFNRRKSYGKSVFMWKWEKGEAKLIDKYNLEERTSMSNNREAIQDLINHLSESLSVEVKSWIDPDDIEGALKIVRACLSIRNYNGGHLVIGFDDKSCAPVLDKRPKDVKKLFHIDKIQHMISKYSSEAFEINVDFPKLSGKEYPVITIPSGVKTPVLVKKNLISQKSGKSLKEGEILVRTLMSNNTPSTSTIQPKDWPKLMNICFENREADIGRFFRRHLKVMNLNTIENILENLGKRITRSSNAELKEFVTNCRERYNERLFGYTYGPGMAFWSVGFHIKGSSSSVHIADQNFMNLLASNNPQYTGFPLWLDSRGFEDSSQPNVINKGWESLISHRDKSDFIRIEPTGLFYHLRKSEDDGLATDQRILNFYLHTLRVTEAIAVALSFANAMGYIQEETNLSFIFQWTDLRDRELSSLHSPEAIFGSHISYDDECTVEIDVPLESPESTIPGYVNIVMRELFSLFNGFSLEESIIEDIARELLERKL